MPELNRAEIALDHAKRLEATLAVLCEYADKDDASLERISLLLSVAYDLTDPLIVSVKLLAGHLEGGVQNA